MSASLDLVLLEKLGDEWQSATPGLCIQAYHRGKKIVDLEVGETYRYYDLASLTKIVFSTTALMSMVDNSEIRLSESVGKYLTWFPGAHPARLKHLLSHDAGMTWWYPFYEDVAQITTARTSPEDAWQYFQKILQARVLEDIKEKGFHVAEAKTVYSDLDFFLLGSVMQEIQARSFYEIWSELKERMGLLDTDFHRGNRPIHARKLYAPTENDQAWRGRVLQGEVHDENTWALKGIAPHAGLFGTMDDLSRWGLLLRRSIRGDKSRGFPSPETVQKFSRRAVPKSRGDWAYGFMMPSLGTASCGPLFSVTSIGHTGFTGTSIWYDPKRDLLVSILSNRVHPTRENKNFVALRPKLHTWIAEEL